MLKKSALAVVALVSLLLANPVFAEFYASKAAETSYDNAPALVIRFTEAIDKNIDLATFVQLTPQLENGSDWITLDEGYSWTLPFVEPNTDYQIRIDQNLISASGSQMVVKDLSVDENNLILSNNWSITTKQLTPSASFAQSGRYLSGKLQNELPVTALNLDELALDIFRVRDDQRDDFLAKTFYSGRIYYDSLNSLKKWADLVHTAQYDLDLRKHTRTTLNLDVSPALAKHEDGIYIAVLRKPGQYEYRFDTQFFTRSNIGLHARVYQNQIKVFANDIKTGQPLQDVEISYHWRVDNSDQSDTGITDQNGVHNEPSNIRPNLIVAEYDNQISFIRMANSQLDLSAYPNSPIRHNELQPFIYGPRDLYRPGETVNINMIMKNYDGSKTQTPPVNAALYDSRGSLVQDFTWRPDNNGHYLFDFSLNDSAPTGDWMLQLKDTDNYQASYRFNVEEFLPERLSLEFYDGALEKYRYVDPGLVSVPIQADYLYGAPASGNRANGVVTVTAATKLFERWNEYYFSDPTKTIRRKTQQIQDIQVDSTGHGELKIPAYWADLEIPLNYRLSASVYEEGGRPITRTQSVIQLPDLTKQYIGIRRGFDERPESNQRAKFNLISVDSNGDPQNDTVDISLIRKSRDYYWYYDDDNGWNWRYNSDIYVAYSQRLDVSVSGTDIELPLVWGDYELQVTSSTGTKTVHPFRTQYSWSNTGSSSMRPEVIDVVLDKDHYAPGESVNLQFNSPSNGVATVQVENSQGIEYFRSFEVTKGINNYSLKTFSSWTRHDYYVSLMVVSPADQVNEVAPQRSLGILPLPMRRTDSVFDISLNTPDRIESNSTAHAELVVNNVEVANGSKVWATMALVDLGVLNITNFERPQPEEFFYSTKRFETEYFDMYGYIINNLNYKTYAQAFGGGFDDSDEQLSRGGDKPKSDVQIISYFSEPVEVINGKAEFDFDIPAFNGRVKWMAVVWSDDTVGSSESETTVADLLITQLSIPRFLAMGDSSELTLDLHNLSGNNQTLDVDISVTGSVTAQRYQASQSFADKEKKSIKVPIQAIDYSGVGTITVNASNGDDINLSRQWTIGTRAPYPIQTNMVRQAIDENQSWAPNFNISNLIESTVSAQVTLSDRPAINFSSHLDHLLNYPYGCLEQTTSSTYPWVLIDQEAYHTLNLASSFEARFNQPYTEAFQLEQLENGIDRLLTKQKDDGSFGYWNASSHSSMWGSVYATELLVDARNIGYYADSVRTQKSLRYLARILTGNISDSIWSDDSGYYTIAYQSYAAMVLAKANRANLSDVRRLYRKLQVEKVTQSGLPWMHLAVALKTLGDEARAKGAATNALMHSRTGSSYYADYGSPVRDTALTLALAMEYKFRVGDLPAQLESSLRERRWLSTQERISLAKVGLQYAKAGTDWQASLVTSEFTQDINQATAFNTLIDGSQLNSIESIDAKDNKVYANIAWNGVSKNAPQATSQGMTISRQFYDINGNRINFASPVTSGELFIAKISLQGDEDRYPEALLVDLLPAGFELENQNLLNASVDLDSIEIEGDNVGDYFRNYRVDYEEYRDDRYVAGVSLTNWSKTNLFYLVRAVTPGTYSFPNSMVEDMYRPEHFAISSTPGTLTVVPAQ